MIFNKIDLNKEINTIDLKQKEFILKYGKRSNILNKKECKPLLEFSYKIVKIEIPDLIKKGEYLEVAEKLFNEKLKKVKANELLNFILWVMDQLEHIYKIEKAKLNSPPDNELIQAGIKNLDVFGELNIIETLANGDILKWDLILELPYYKVLDKLIKLNIEKQIQKNYQKIIEQKSKLK